MIARTTCPVQSLPCTYNWLKKKVLKQNWGKKIPVFTEKED